MSPTHLPSSDDPRWVELAALVERISGDGAHVKWKGADRTDDGALVLPWPDYDVAVRATVSLLYDLGVIAERNWPDWARPNGEDAGDPRWITGASLDDTVMLLTTIVRQERFVDGAIAAALESGQLGAALDRLLQLVSDTQY